MAESRSRSASPTREEPAAKKQKTGGFKWKEKKPKNDDEVDARDGGTLERGYRNRSSKRPSYSERDQNRINKDLGYRSVIWDDAASDALAKRDSESSRPQDPQRPMTEQQKSSNGANTTITPAGNGALDPPPPMKKEKKEKKPKVPVSTEPMIIVNINDRLGTKAAIPCLASDSIKAFKAVVAAHIGRQPHEIMLKRQGERPFKDQLTLQDYGVSNGVQLDLELDTGD